MYLALLKKQKITSVVIMALSFFVYGFLPIFKANAQPVIITSTDNINVTASVPGCGDNYIQTGLGEQCEGPNSIIKNLNDQSCSSLGFETGTLGCRDTCIFDTSSCSGVSSGGSSSGGSSNSKKRDISSNFQYSEVPNISDTNLIFSGMAGPGDIIVILDGKKYFASGIAASDGTFSIVISDFKGDTYNFNFYSTSQEFGRSIPLGFKAIVKENATTQISNIHLLYPEKTVSTGLSQKIEEKLNPLFDVLLVNVTEHKKSLFPFTAIFLVGLGLLGLIRFLIFLRRILGRKYIDHYER